jgi:hypothetical protein
VPAIRVRLQSTQLLHLRYSALGGILDRRHPKVRHTLPHMAVHKQSWIESGMEFVRRSMDTSAMRAYMTASTHKCINARMHGTIQQSTFPSLPSGVPSATGLHPSEGPGHDTGGSTNQPRAFVMAFRPALAYPHALTANKYSTGNKLLG